MSPTGQVAAAIVIAGAGVDKGRATLKKGTSIYRERRYHLTACSIFALLLIVSPLFFFGNALGQEPEKKAQVISSPAYSSQTNDDLNRFLLRILEMAPPDQRVRIPDVGPVFAEGKAEFPVEIIRLLFSDLHPTGTMTVFYKLWGTREKPQLEAGITINNGALSIPGISETLHGITGNATLSSNSLIIDELTGGMGDGSFRVSGKISSGPPSPQGIQLSLTLTEIPISVPDMLEMKIGGNLAVNGPMAAPRMTGLLRLISGTWFRDTNLNPIIRETAAIPSQAPPKPADSSPKKGFWEGMALDIDVSHQSPFWVDNNLGRLALVPDFRISGTAGHPVPAGRAVVEEGDIYYQSKPFKIEKGMVDFSSPNPGGPMVEVVGSADVRKWLVRLTLSGTPEGLNISLSSDPPLEESDIVSLVSVGRTSEDLIAKEGGSTVSPSQVLAGIIDSSYGEKLKRTTGLDILDAESIPDEDPNQPDRIRFTIGENLSNRMTVKYTTETREGLFIQQFISEYKLLDKLILSGYQDSEAAYGAGVTYRLEFK
jgi:translocation and assembly module TamB